MTLRVSSDSTPACLRRPGNLHLPHGSCGCQPMALFPVGSCLRGATFLRTCPIRMAVSALGTADRWERWELHARISIIALVSGSAHRTGTAKRRVAGWFEHDAGVRKTSCDPGCHTVPRPRDQDSDLASEFPHLQREQKGSEDIIRS